MMTLLGTCKHTHQIQEAYSMSTQPHDKMRRVDSSEMFQCGFNFSELPPPIKRVAGANDLRAGDCEACKHYTPASTFPKQEESPGK